MTLAARSTLINECNIISAVQIIVNENCFKPVLLSVTSFSATKFSLFSADDAGDKVRNTKNMENYVPALSRLSFIRVTKWYWNAGKHSFYAELWTVISLAKKHWRKDQKQTAFIQATEEQVQNYILAILSEYTC